MGVTDVEGNHFKMGVDDWDIIGQCTTSLMTVGTVVKQTEGDTYPTNILVLSFMNSYMRSLSEDDLSGHWKREQRISRLISACLCPICTPKHQGGHGG